VGQGNLLDVYKKQHAMNKKAATEHAYRTGSL
jgi:hypothetical protein